MRFLAITALLLAVCPEAVSAEPNVVIQWDNAALQGIRDAKLGAPVVARALAIVHTCMYDAWAAYDDRAVGTQLHDALRRPASQRTYPNKERAISYTAYRALVDVLPVDTTSVYTPLMKQLGYDPSDISTDIETGGWPSLCSKGKSGTDGNDPISRGHTACFPNYFSINEIFRYRRSAACIVPRGVLGRTQCRH